MQFNSGGCGRDRMESISGKNSFLEEDEREKRLMKIQEKNILKQSKVKWGIVLLMILAFLVKYGS